MIKLAVILPVFNGLDFTKSCLEILANQILDVGNQDQVILVLVDDGSTDGTSDWVKANFPEVHIVPGDGKLWWSGAVNEGVRFALEKCNATHILWWNNDVIPAEHYLEKIVQLLGNNSGQLIFGSKIYHLSNKNTIWSMGGYFNPKNGKKDMIARNVPDRGFEQELEVDWFPGMGTVIPKKVFETIGYCNAKDFPQYHGDSDFTYRAKLAGFKLITHPGLKIYNDTRHTGLKHNDSFKGLRDSITDVRSLYNVSKDLAFYRKYAQSPGAYQELVKKYAKYFLGFLKWKMLAVFGKKRNA